ncbi:MAG TPA: tRNA (adenosine(37)-N6)-threonylcarbamoyltransferase complex transferase subunit TsaD [Gemmatimonadales bacterium]|jgi:N6-L-threonylcarbamoyladenine synthase|nr:tRNA (adenosine(37)-N6)-threonylcarbamoyltransferase complex transferase subunit TsaD [Gemmatimonadales bacterium]
MTGRILAIETSCDETSAAVLETGSAGPTGLKSLVILSQDIHAVFGGVVPELASRAHLRTIGSVVERALTGAGVRLDDVSAVAVTAGPGLVGALLVGVMYGKSLAFARGLPFLGVHHMEGHLFAATLEDPDFQPPFVGLLVSGGHTMLLDVPEWGRYRLLGQTRDDAAGEAFDKVATLLGLGYPGGPAIEKLAATGRSGRYDFPRPMLREMDREGSERYEFSFSGLKTAVLRATKSSDNLERDRPDLARGFQDAVLDVLVEKTARAAEEVNYPTVMVGGGVACNQTLVARLRERMKPWARVVAATPRLNTDNAAMIGAAAAWRLARGERSGWDLEPRADMVFPGLTD